MSEPDLISRDTLGSYVSNTLDALTLELAAIEFLHSCSQVCGGLKLDETSITVSQILQIQAPAFEAYPRPFESRPVSE